MADPIRILLLEDSPDDAQLVQLSLEQQGIQAHFQRVATREDFVKALQHPPDLLLLDYQLPGFDGLSALQIARGQGLDIPCIFVSGTYGDDVLAGVMPLGADDFLVKDRLARLGNSIWRALDAKRLREEKKRTDAALFESERRLRAMLKNLHLIAIMLDINGDITFCNDFLLQLTGWSRKSVFGKNWFDMFIPKERGEIKQLFCEAIQSGELSDHYEYPILTKAGELRIIKWNNTVLRGVDGEVIGTASVGEDITEHVHMEKALRDSQHLFQKIFEVSPLPSVLLHLPEQVVVEVSPAFERATGYTRTEMLGRSIAEFDLWVDPSQRQRIGEALTTTGRVHDQEIVFKTRSGETGFGLFYAETIELEKDTYVLIKVLDITGRRQVEERLRISEERVKLALTAANDGLWDWQVQTGETYFSPRWKSILGYQDDEILNTYQAWEVRLHPEDKARVLQDLQAHFDDSTRDYAPEFRMQHKSGAWVWIQARGRVVERDLPGCPIRMIGTHTDITERKRAEEKLQKSRAEYQALINTIEGIVWEADANTFKFSFVSQQAERLLGYPSRQWIEEGQFWKDHIHPEDQTWAVDYCVACTRDMIPHQFEYRMLAADGRIIWLRDIVTVIGENGQPSKLRGIMVDISQQKQAEEALLRHAERQTALYQLLRRVSGEADPNQILQISVDTIAKWGRWQSIAISLLEPNEQAWRVRATGGPLSGPLDGPHYLKEGIMGRAYRTSRTQVVDNVNTDPDFFSGTPARIQSELAVPIRHQQQTIGVLNIESERISGFKPEDVALAESLAETIGLALGNAEQQTALAHHAGNMATLSETSQQILTTLDLNEVYQHTHAAVQKLMPCEAFVIAIRDEAKLEIEDVYLWDEGRRWPSQRHATGQGLTDYIIASGRMLRINHWDESHTRMTNATVFGELEKATQSVLAVPLYNAQGQSFGMISSQSYQPEAYTTEHEQLLTTLASQVAKACENARLFNELQQELAERKRAEEQTRQQVQRLEGLHQIDMAITSGLEMKSSLNLMLDRILSLLKVDAADILIWEPHTYQLRYSAGRGFHSNAIQHTELRLGQGHAGRAAFDQQSIYIPDLSQISDDLSRALSLKREFFKSYFAVPLIAKGRVKGVLEIFQRTALQPDKDWFKFAETMAHQAAILIEDTQLFSELQRSNFELATAYDATIEGWSRAMDLRDKETEGHTQRVTELTLRLARVMNIPESSLIHLRRGGLLHDIGKLGIPDNILLKREALTPLEWEIMKQHPRFAHEMLAHIPYLQPALIIPYCHHEKWDGTGYPQGLKGEQIPLEARIFTVADVWDAITSDRPYRPAWSKETALEYIAEQSGKYFDPRVVEAFMAMIT